ncbi:MAG: CDP-alcohol phosphatidyltransferase family protein [Oscillospiraceae bacterium]|nr:CDP-alcohol phosphatidyltransferase family protein [Oscillospiraceae bacterium]
MKQKEKILIGYGNVANFITILGLFFSLACCFYAIRKNIPMSATLLIISGLCDMFDGFVAKKIKRTDVEKNYGIQLDSIVDVISFGIIPAILVFSITGASWYKLLVYVFYAICSVTRLAYFNTTATPDTPIQYYRGLPITSISLILPAVLLFHSIPVNLITLTLVGILYVLNIKVPKARGIWYVVFIVFAISLIFLWWWL